MQMWFKVTFISIKCYNKSHQASQEGANGKAIYLSVIYFQTRNSEILSGFYALFYFQIFENWWCITLPYSIILLKLWKLMVYYCCRQWTAASSFWICHQTFFKAFNRCYFSVNTGLLTKEKPIIGSLKKSALKIFWETSENTAIKSNNMYSTYIYLYKIWYE